jgi:hypothetical protein
MALLMAGVGFPAQSGELTVTQSYPVTSISRCSIGSGVPESALRTP